MSYVIHAEFLVKEDKINYFKKIILAHAHESITTEKGCQIFDVCQCPDKKNLFFLYEVYFNEDEYFSHRSTERYKNVIQEISKCVIKNDGNLFFKRQVLTKIIN